MCIYIYIYIYIYTYVYKRTYTCVLYMHNIYTHIIISCHGRYIMLHLVREHDRHVELLAHLLQLAHDASEVLLTLRELAYNSNTNTIYIYIYIFIIIHKT